MASSTQCSDWKCCVQSYGKCGVWGCTSCVVGQQHLCRTCGIQPSDHRACHCLHIEVRPPSPPVYIPNAVPLQTRTAPPTVKIPPGAKHAGVYIVSNYNGWNYLLCHVRNVPGASFGSLCTPGGSVDNGEAASTAAAREAMEEAGILVDPRKLKAFYVSNGGIVAFYVVVPWGTPVKGPDARHAWEVNLNEKFSYKGCIPLPGTGHAWIALDQVQTIARIYPTVHGLFLKCAGTLARC